MEKLLLALFCDIIFLKIETRIDANASKTFLLMLKSLAMGDLVLFQTKSCRFNLRQVWYTTISK